MQKKVLTRDELEKMYREENVTELAEKLNVTLKAFYKLLDEAGIERKNPNSERKQRSSYEIIE